MLREPGGDGLGASLAQLLVVPRVARRIGVALDAHVPDLGVLVQCVADLEEHSVALRQDLGALAPELDLLGDLDLVLLDPNAPRAAVAPRVVAAHPRRAGARVLASGTPSLSSSPSRRVPRRRSSSSLVAVSSVVVVGGSPLDRGHRAEEGRAVAAYDARAEAHAHAPVFDELIVQAEERLERRGAGAERAPFDDRASVELRSEDQLAAGETRPGGGAELEVVAQAHAPDNLRPPPLEAELGRVHERADLAGGVDVGKDATTPSLV